MHSNMELLVAGLMLYSADRNSRRSAAVEDEFYRTHAGWQIRKRIAGLMARLRATRQIFGPSRAPRRRQTQPESVNLCDCSVRA